MKRHKREQAHSSFTVDSLLKPFRGLVVDTPMEADMSLWNFSHSLLDVLVIGVSFESGTSRQLRSSITTLILTKSVSNKMSSEIAITQNSFAKHCYCCYQWNNLQVKYNLRPK